MIVFERGLQKYAIEWTTGPLNWTSIREEQYWGAHTDHGPPRVEANRARSV